MTYADKPWLKSYKLGPYKLEHSLAPFPEVPVYKLLDDAADKYPGQTAVLYLNRKIKYGELKVLADKLAAALIGMGVQKGDRVCVFLPNCPEFIISDWAILKAGAAMVPTSILRTNDGLVYEAGSSQSRVIICREEQLEKVLGLKEQCDFEHVIVTSTTGWDVKDVSVSLPKGVYEFRKLLEENDPLATPVAIDPKEDLCELAFTGGATGLPKGVMVTHFNRHCCILQGFLWMLKPLLRGLAGKASVFLPVPLFHAYGHYIHQAAASLGLRIILMPDPRDTPMLVEYIQKYRPFMIPTVPTQLMRIAQAKVGKMNVIPICGAAPLPREVSEIIKKEMGTPVSEGYGLTETSPLTHFNISPFSKITGFIAKEKSGMGVPSPDTECKLVDLDTGEEVPFGEHGEVVVRGPQIMKGYWPEQGSGLTAAGWLHTGDIAYMDEDGYFHLSDRVKDMVNVSGMKVYTTTVDEVLYKHPGIHMAAAIGVPDPNTPGSERVMAIVQLKNEFKEKVTADEIQDFCRKHLSPYAVPKFVEFRDDLPMTVTEKLFKKALRDEVVAKFEQTD
ncbi:AMP-binding protein [Thermodesulfobacteriota bacterium]